MLVLIAVDAGLPAPHQHQAHPVPIWLRRCISRHECGDNGFRVWASPNQEFRECQLAFSGVIQVGFADARPVLAKTLQTGRKQQNDADTPYVDEAMRPLLEPAVAHEFEYAAPNRGARATYEAPE